MLQIIRRNSKTQKRHQFYRNRLENIANRQLEKSQRTQGNASQIELQIRIIALNLFEFQDTQKKNNL